MSATTIRKARPRAQGDANARKMQRTVGQAYSPRPVAEALTAPREKVSRLSPGHIRALAQGPSEETMQ